MTIEDDTVLLALSYDLTPEISVVFAYFEDGKIGRSLSADPKFACRHEAVKFFDAYRKARAEFLDGVYALTGKRVRVVDEKPRSKSVSVN